MLTRKRLLLLMTLVSTACQPSTPVPAVRNQGSPQPTLAPQPTASTVTREPAPISIAGAAIPFPSISSGQLPNGLAFDVIERRGIPIVQLSLVAAAGHAKDENHPGVARILAQLLEAGGAGKWSSEKLREAVDALGASLDVTSTRDNMRWSLAVTSDKVPEALEILAALAQKPRFDRAEFVKLKQRELERVKSLAKTSGSWLAQYWLHRELYQQPMGIHPYASVDVLPSEIERLGLEDCRRFYQAHLGPRNVRIMAVGNIDLTTLTRLVEGTFGNWTAKVVPDGGISEPNPPDRLRLFVVDRPGSAQSDIQLGLLGPSRKSDDFVPILAIQQIVGGGVAGRLFMDVREKRSLAYSTYAGIQEVAFGPSVLTLSAGTQTAKTSEALAALLEHLDRLQSDPGSLPELETAQNFIMRGMPTRWETVESLSNQLLLLRTQGQSDRYFDDLRAQIGALSTPVLKVPATRYYPRNRAVVVVAGDAEKIAEGLRQFGPVEVLNPEREFSIKRALSAQ
jgi:zinc protease